MQEKFRKFFIEIQKDLKLYGFLILLFSLYRLLFILAMPEFLSEETTFKDIFFALWIGLRLSLKSAGIVVLISFLICSVSRFFLKADLSKLRFYLGAIYTIFLTILFQARFPYYNEFHSTFNHNIFNAFKEDGNALLITMIQQYHLILKLSIADLELDLLNKTASRANENIVLTSKEFTLLEFLIKNKDRVLSETTINSALSSFEDSNISNIVNVYIYRLRNKIDKKFDKKLIKTIRGIGFKISDK